MWWRGNFSSSSQSVQWFSTVALLCMGAAVLTGCGGGAGQIQAKAGQIQAKDSPARIQGLKLDADGPGSLLLIVADREFRAIVQARADLSEIEIQVPFAVAPNNIKSLIGDMRLPREGIRSIQVGNLTGKSGGVRFSVLTDGAFPHSSKQSGKEFFLRLEKGPTLAAADVRVQAPRGEKEPEEPGKKKEPQFLVPQVPTSKEKDYAIGGRDVLRIVVFEEPEMSKDDIRVSNDGYITFPLIGRVRAEGLTPNELEKEMARRLGKDFLVNPQVTVQVKDFASKTVNVLGAVKLPGAIALQGPITLLETLARAGGVNIEDAGRNIIILRPRPGKEKDVEHITINLNQLLKMGELSQNVALQNKDTVFIPQADQIFVFGEVKNPGPYKLRERSISVVEAITMAGGTTRLAAANRTRVVRVKGERGTEQVIQINVDNITKSGDKSKDIQLQAGDIVVVPETYF